MAHVVVYDASEHHIHGVLVSRLGGARISRKIQLELKSGPNEVTIESLPNSLQSRTISLESAGSTITGDVRYFSSPKKDDSQAQSPALERLLKRKRIVEAERNNLQRQLSILDGCGDSLHMRGLDTKEVDEFLTMYSSRSRRLQLDVLAAEEKIDDLSKEITHFSARHSRSPHLNGKITFTTSAERDGPAHFSISYVVQDAHWTPRYDLRVKVSNNEKSRSTFRLHYFASLRQSSGETWENVPLSLTTGSLVDGYTIPELKGQIIERNAARTPGETEIQNVTHVLDDTYTIHSRALSEAATYKDNVPISVTDFLDASLEWTTIPQQVSQAIILCRILNTSDYQLLPGQVDIYRNRTFVSAAAMPLCTQSEHFNCSLGTDPHVAVTYHSFPGSVKVPPHSGPASLMTSFRRAITIVNRRGNAIPKFTIKESVPTSRDPEIKVNLTEPAGLDRGMASQQGFVHVGGSEHLKARWAVDGGSSKTAVEWSCHLNAGQTRVLNIAWDVVAPASLNWTSRTL
ncbi:hypothetical protein SISNIDRAFT_350559 [Sistotremastrum niveocremeum HHB9708]|uniref:Mucoidy inhibitor A n=1 Tax=Sistotremastrum niveocremeum HHB9708 TaxID=1314777 RepID=A0A164WZ74_9AGAM|nr:hypothetical protein SISNIDRAFT_350559 [Sistotremastrum niveocremeum HHB9708]